MKRTQSHTASWCSLCSKHKRLLEVKTETFNFSNERNGGPDKLGTLSKATEDVVSRARLGPGVPIPRPGCSIIHLVFTLLPVHTPLVLKDIAHVPVHLGSCTCLGSQLAFHSSSEVKGLGYGPK